MGGGTKQVLFSIMLHPTKHHNYTYWKGFHHRQSGARLSCSVEGL